MNKDFKICPRLEHFRRLETDGRFGVCGHMVSGNSFGTLKELEDSKWLESLKQKMDNNIMCKILCILITISHLNF